MRFRMILALGLVPLLPTGGAPPRPVAGPTVPERIVSNPNRAPAGRLGHGVLTIRLELRTGMLTPQADDGPGLLVQAFAEAGKPLQVPGPLVRVVEGTVIHATVHNRLPDSTLVLRGLHPRPGLPNDTLQVAPGATRDVRFTAGTPGPPSYLGTDTAPPEGGKRPRELGGGHRLPARDAAPGGDRVDAARRHDDRALGAGSPGQLGVSLPFRVSHIERAVHGTPPRGDRWTRGTGHGRRRRPRNGWPSPRHSRAPDRKGRPARRAYRRAADAAPRRAARSSTDRLRAPDELRARGGRPRA